MNWHEEPLVFDCEGRRLIGVITHPERPQHTGVVIVVGGPQYRAGSHRQFTLLARQLAEQGIATIRFDYRGMGDSEGDMRNFEAIDADIRAAIDNLMTQVPDIKQVNLWGLCDAASAALYYGHTDPRVKGIIMLNPWVHTDAGAAHVRFKHYYLSRLMQRSFWIKLLTGKIMLSESASGLSKSALSVTTAKNWADPVPADPRHGSSGYIERMLDGLKRFHGPVFFILSGNDLTAQEFISLAKRDKIWKRLCHSPRVSMDILDRANHTFSSQILRGQVSARTAQWVIATGKHA